MFQFNLEKFLVGAIYLNVILYKYHHIVLSYTRNITTLLPLLQVCGNK